MGQLVEMVVESVRVHMPSSQHVVILKEVDRERYLPIWIGPWEANAIAMKLQGVSSERPLTHDLFSTTLDELGVTCAGSSSPRWPRRRSTPGSSSSRASASSRSTRGRPTRSPWPSGPGSGSTPPTRSSTGRGCGPEDSESGSIEDLESTGDAAAPTDPRLDVFRDFVNSLDLGGDAGTREGPRPD